MSDHPTSNITLAPYRGSMCGLNENGTLREFFCSTCNDHLFSLVLPHYFDGNLCHLVWLPRVVCGKDHTHALIPRAEGEDANLHCVGRGIRDYEIPVYLKKYEEVKS